MHDDATDIDDRPFLRTVRVDLCENGTAIAQTDGHTHTLRAITALVKTLPNGLKPSVDLGSRSPEALAFVMSLPGAHPGKTHAADETGDDILYAWATVDGVEIIARMRQPRTP